MIITFLKSILAGAFISTASYIYLQTGGIAGSILFSIGLLIILNMKLKLYTGTIGYIKCNAEDISNNAVVLLGNIIGTLFIMQFPHSLAPALVVNKLSIPAPALFLKSFVCGMFIFAAVESFKQKKDYMVPVCVCGFILFGGEHCIADLSYIIIAKMLSPQILSFFIITVLGNSLGAIVLRRVSE